MGYMLVFCVVVTAAVLWLLSRLAAPLGLVDIPDKRKSHHGHVPVVGGLAIILSLAACVWFFSLALPLNAVVLGLALVLLVLGLIDDKKPISPKIRIMMQFLVALLTVAFGDQHLYFFGNIFNLGDFYLGFWGELLSVLAIVTAINAFNMIDGIDGLLASLLVVLFGALWLLDRNFMPFYSACICALLVFLLFNLGAISSQKNGKRKIFMGDAGAMVAGYLVVCLLMDKSQYPDLAVRPVTVLWLIAVPLMDLVAIVIRRSRKRQPIMKADRDHLHHICLRMGLSDRRALFIIVLIAVIFAAIGLYSEAVNANESLIFALFVLIFSAYLYFILHAWRFVRAFNLIRARRNKYVG